MSLQFTKSALLSADLLYCRQDAKLVSGLFYHWSLLRNNNLAANLKVFT